MSIIYLTDENFKKEIEDYKGVSLVDFWASWCGPCQMIVPIIEKLAKEYQGKVKIGKLEVDENPRIASKYDILSLPTLKIFVRGKVMEDFLGVQSEETLKESLEKWLQRNK